MKCLVRLRNNRSIVVNTALAQHQVPRNGLSRAMITLGTFVMGSSTGRTFYNMKEIAVLEQTDFSF